MQIAVNLPKELVSLLETEANNQQMSLDELVIQLLQTAVRNDFPSLETIVTHIQATPANPEMIKRAEGSLAEALKALPPDPTFNLAQWEQEWAQVEAHMKEIEQADRLADTTLYG